MSCLRALATARFNSRSRVGSDARQRSHEGRLQVFQFTLPCRERPLSIALASLRATFQFTLPCRERLSGRGLSPHLRGCFNSRSRVGSDLGGLRRYAEGSGFNSRSRVGSDRCFTAPLTAKGGFNSRSRVGSDKRQNCKAREAALFQFTLPCRERPRLLPTFRRRARFNSRSRVGSDTILCKCSIPASFQFTLPCRERHAEASPFPLVIKFQFTLPCRERLLAQGGLLGLALFQFTLPCRERRRLTALATQPPPVSIHAPV